MSKTTATVWCCKWAIRRPTILERNNPTVQFQHDWTTFQMEIRQPLLQGYGVEFNRIAGPGAIPGFNQGVLIARVNTDIALATFEASVRNLVSDVETAYWELYFAYRNLDSAVRPRQRLADLAKGLRPIKRGPRAAMRRPRPRPASSTSSSAARPSRPCRSSTRPRASSAT